MLNYHKQAVESSRYAQMGVLPSSAVGYPCLLVGQWMFHFENANHTMALATAKKKVLAKRWRAGDGEGGLVKWSNNSMQL